MKEQYERFNNMKKSQQYKIFKRLEALDFTWDLCNENKKELFKLISKLEKISNFELFQIYNSVISLLTRHLINHVGTVFLMVEYMRKENKFLTEHKNGIVDYQDKVNEYFVHNPNTQFVHGLRNHVIHNKMIRIETESHITNEEFDSTILILKTDTLLESKHWNSYAKKYILQNEPKINLRNCLTDYSNLQKKFYLWFKTEYRRKFKKEISYCEKIINDWNATIEEKRKKIENMSFDEFMSLPKLICNSEGGFFITSVES